MRWLKGTGWRALARGDPVGWSDAVVRELRQNLRPISLLAVGLVLATTAGVAAVAHVLLPGMGWAEAIGLGAIVSPADAVSATAVGKRLRIPRRVVTILEGESLVNDATALVLSRAAVGAVVSGSFLFGGTVLNFVFAALAALAIGIGAAWLTRWALCATEDGYTQIGVTCLFRISPGSLPSRSMHRPCWLVWQAGSPSASISAARWRPRHVCKLAPCENSLSLFSMA